MFNQVVESDASRAARDDAKDARDAAARNERALTQRDESLARTSKDFEAAATSEIESLK